MKNYWIKDILVKTNLRYKFFGVIEKAVLKIVDKRIEEICKFYSYIKVFLKSGWSLKVSFFEFEKWSHIENFL